MIRSLLIHGYGNTGRRQPDSAILASLLFLALAGGAAYPVPARAAPRVTLLLNWLPGGIHVPLFFARDRGLFRKAGLEVAIRSARGSRDALGRMHRKEAEFALAETGELISHRAGGLDTRGVMVYMARSPIALLSLRKTGIHGFSDLAGKRIAAPRASFARLLFPELGKKTAIELARVRWLSLSPAELLPALLAGKTDAVASSTIVAHQYRAAARKKGEELAILPYAEAGVNPYSLVLVTMDSVIAKDASRARAFVRAVAEALATALERPEVALEVFLKANPTLGRERIGAEWEMARSLISPGAKPRDGFGRFQEARMKTMTVLMQRIRNTELPVGPGDLFTNDLIAPPASGR